MILKFPVVVSQLDPHVITVLPSALVIAWQLLGTLVNDGNMGDNLRCLGLVSFFHLNSGTPFCLFFICFCGVTGTNPLTLNVPSVCMKMTSCTDGRYLMNMIGADDIVCRLGGKCSGVGCSSRIVLWMIGLRCGCGLRNNCVGV